MCLNCMFVLLLFHQVRKRCQAAAVLCCAVTVCCAVDLGCQVNIDQVHEQGQYTLSLTGRHVVKSNTWLGLTKVCRSPLQMAGTTGQPAGRRWHICTSMTFVNIAFSFMLLDSDRCLYCYLVSRDKSNACIDEVSGCFWGCQR